MAAKQGSIVNRRVGVDPAPPGGRQPDDAVRRQGGQCTVGDLYQAFLFECQKRAAKEEPGFGPIVGWDEWPKEGFRVGARAGGAGGCTVEGCDRAAGGARGSAAHQHADLAGCVHGIGRVLAPRAVRHRCPARTSTRRQLLGDTAVRGRRRVFRRTRAAALHQRDCPLPRAIASEPTSASSRSRTALAGRGSPYGTQRRPGPDRDPAVGASAARASARRANCRTRSRPGDGTWSLVSGSGQERQLFDLYNFADCGITMA